MAFLTLAVLIPATAGAATDGKTTLSLANGLAVTIYSADYLTARLSTFNQYPAIRLEDGRFVPVTTDINDPSIYNKGDGSFHPFTRDLVETALRAVEHPGMRLSVRVYLLPYPRRGLPVSSTTGNEIFLSPHVLDIEPAVGSFIVAHELGHAFHNQFMPDGSSGWTQYRRLRGITDGARFNDNAAHAYRPKEIFAEDFRVLFGGPVAAFGGAVENPELVSPEAVNGLESFYVRVATTGRSDVTIAAASYPNPFNPETEIRVTVPTELTERGAPVSVRIYSVTGAEVRDLHQGKASGDFVVRWDGRDRSGNPVVSGTYYAAVCVGEARETLKLVLLK